MRRKLFGKIQKLQASSELNFRRDRDLLAAATTTAAKDGTKMPMSNVFRLPVIKDVANDGDGEGRGEKGAEGDGQG